jgi:hypothetical protein
MLTRRAALAGILATALTGGVTVALPVLAHTSTAAPQPRFSRPMILTGGGAEPSIRVPADGKSAAYISAPTGLGSNFWRITKKRNNDGTVTFNQGPVMQPDLGTGGGDSEISVGDLTQDSPANGCVPIAYSGLHNIDLLDNFTVARSTDCGKSFDVFNPFATQNTLTDRQWQVFDGANTNFLIYHLVSTGQIAVSVSPDGGAHYVSYGASNANGVIEPQLLAASGNNQQIGNIIVNHAEPIKGATNVVSGEPVHAMYAIFGLASDAGIALQSNVPGSEYNGMDTIYVGKSIDGGVTWTDTKVFSVNPKTKRELNMLFPVISADSAGNLYAAWADTYKVEYSVSTDHGAHWSKPYQVNRDNRGVGKGGVDLPDPGKADVFPWIAAGGNGLLDVVWYHGQGGAPKSNRVYRDPGDDKTKWTVAFAQLGHATRTVKGAASPKVLTYSDAITPVMHVGDICQNGTLCDLGVDTPVVHQHDRSLLDFFQVAIDREGRAHLAIADNAKAPNQLISAYTAQLTGVSITTGRPLKPLKVSYPKLNCDAAGTFTDDEGDATQLGVGDPGTASQDGLDLRRGWVTWDAANKIATFHLQVTDLAANPPTGSTGQIFRFNFGWATKGYGVEATRDVTTGTSFTLRSTEGLGTTIYDGLEGAFDDAHNEVRVEVPADVFGKVTDDAAKAPPLTTGASITGLAGETRRSYPEALAPVADAAEGVCPATLAAGGAASGGASGYLPSAPTLGGTQALRNLLPSALFAVLVGACVTAWTGRRRRGMALA